MVVNSTGSGFAPILECTDLDDWRSHLAQMLGDCQVNLRRHNMHGFAARIGLSVVGCLSLVELGHRGGQMELRRRQQADAAVLWIPEVGAMEERRLGPTVGAAEEWQNGPGQAMWIAPETELLGLTDKGSTGVSIVVPRPLLSELGELGGPTTVLDPFRTHRPPTLVPLLRSARELISAARVQPAWLEHSAGEFWQALVRHSEAGRGPRPVEPDAHQAALLSTRFLEEARQRLQRDPTARLPLEPMALALHVSPRTLQSRLRQELDASPREAWESMRNDPHSGQQGYRRMPRHWQEARDQK